MRTKKLIATGVAVFALIALGCASQGGGEVTFHDPNMDFGLIQSVAVLPFENLTSAAKAEEQVRDVFMTMLQATEAFYVHPPGEVRRTVSRVQPDSHSTPTAEEAVRLATNLEADVVITGRVLEFGRVRSGTAGANVCSVSVKMLEGQTGRVIWSASATSGGIGMSERLLGGGGEPMNLVVSQAVNDLLDRLFRVE